MKIKDFKTFINESRSQGTLFELFPDFWISYREFRGGRHRFSGPVIYEKVAYLDDFKNLGVSREQERRLQQKQILFAEFLTPGGDFAGFIGRFPIESLSEFEELLEQVDYPETFKVDPQATQDSRMWATISVFTDDYEDPFFFWTDNEDGNIDAKDFVKDRHLENIGREGIKIAARKLRRSESDFSTDLVGIYSDESEFENEFRAVAGERPTDNTKL